MNSITCSDYSDHLCKKNIDIKNSIKQNQNG